MNATRTIPIVMTGGGADPVEAGLIESLASPGGNVTGVTYLGLKLGGKWLELLKKAIPKLARVAVLYDPEAGPGPVDEVKEFLAVAPALRLTVQPTQIGVTIPPEVLARQRHGWIARSFTSSS
jgi:putative ABC transport system substrate-binding protein